MAKKIGVKFGRENKPNEFEARGYVIDRLIEIEFIIDDILRSFIRPGNSEFFNETVLNGSILDMGKKIKLLSNIFDLLKIDTKIISKLRDLVSIRNGFAHSYIHTTTRIKNTQIDKYTIQLNLDSVIDRLYVMNSNGVIKEKNAQEYFTEFFEIYETVSDELNEISRTHFSH